jgi:hypothetical protein
VRRDLGVNQSRQTALDEVMPRAENAGEKICKKGLDNSGNIEGISNAILPQSRRECTPWAAEATSIPPAGPAACQRLASSVGSRQATGPRRRARPGRVAGDGQPARLGPGPIHG